MPELDRVSRRPRRIMVVIFCVVAVVATAFAWTGMSLKDVLTAIHFW